MYDLTRSRLALVAGMALLLVACGSDVPEEPAAGETVVSPGPSGSGAPDALAILEALYPERGAPPVGLVIADLVEGDGATASPGQRVVMQYWGLRWSDAGTFDASWTRGEPFTFRLGAQPQQVITGWEIGVEGMRVGGRRVLVIPPDLAYGDLGAGNVIGPGETLFFVVDLVDTDAP